MRRHPCAHALVSIIVLSHVTLSAQRPPALVSPDVAPDRTSLGGELALSVGIRHADVFGWMGSFASSLQQPDFEPRLGSQLASADTLSRSFRLIWMGCGDGDLLLPGNRALDEALTSRRVPHTLRVIPGFHGMPTFRTLFVELLPLLFR